LSVDWLKVLVLQNICGANLYFIGYELLLTANLEIEIKDRINMMVSGREIVE
jgi:hypothetical protein